MQVGQKMSELKFKLVDEKTGEELALPALRTDWTGARAWIDSWKPSRFIGNAGYVFDRNGYGFTPSTYGAKIVEVAST